MRCRRSLVRQHCLRFPRRSVLRMFRFTTNQRERSGRFYVISIYRSTRAKFWRWLDRAALGRARWFLSSHASSMWPRAGSRLMVTMCAMSRFHHCAHRSAWSRRKLFSLTTHCETTLHTVNQVFRKEKSRPQPVQRWRMSSSVSFQPDTKQ